MPTFGLGNFMYEMTVEGQSAKFNFYDPEDVSNSAEASVSQKEMPEKKVGVDGREVSEIAYGKVAKQLNDKRAKRLADEQTKELEDRLERDAKAVEASTQFYADSEEGSVKPAKEEKDGTRVYNTEGAPKPVKTDADKK